MLAFLKHWVEWVERKKHLTSFLVSPSPLWIALPIKWEVHGSPTPMLHSRTLPWGPDTSSNSSVIDWVYWQLQYFPMEVTSPSTSENNRWNWKFVTDTRQCPAMSCPLTLLQEWIVINLTAASCCVLFGNGSTPSPHTGQSSRAGVAAPGVLRRARNPWKSNPASLCPCRKTLKKMLLKVWEGSSSFWFP